MIWIRFAGGLGNQLFQYAAGLKLKRETQMKLCFELSGLSNYSTPRAFMIDKIIGEFERNDVALPGTIKFLIRNRINKAFPTFFKWVINNGNISSYKRSSFYVVDDYFQDINIIIDEIQEIKEQVNDNYMKNEKLQIIFKKLTETSKYTLDEIVVVHIRRGDYVNLPENKSIFPCLNNNYYIEALRKLKGIKKVVLFSDEYMEENFFPKNVELNIIKAEKLEDFEEFLLMTRFKNYIIANSTFSFWGAILSQSIEKVLIGPKKWSFIEDENMKWNENLSKMNFSFVNL